MFLGQTLGGKMWFTRFKIFFEKERHIHLDFFALKIAIHLIEIISPTNLLGKSISLNFVNYQNKLTIYQEFQLISILVFFFIEINILVYIPK